MIPFCKETGVGLIPWSPLARGVLARPLGDRVSTTRGKSDNFLTGTSPHMSIATTESSHTIINRVQELAGKKGVPMATIALAWSLSKGMIPIVGFSSTQRVDEAVNALSIKLTPEEIAYLEEAYRPERVQSFA